MEEKEKKVEKTLHEKDMGRLQIYKEYEDGTAIGSIPSIKNVNSSVWKDFKRISRLFANSEGAAFTACVMAFQSNPMNAQKLLEMRVKEEKLVTEDE